MKEATEQDSPIPAVVYAARSKAEEEGKDSTGDQIAEILARIGRDGGRRIVGEPHIDHASGFTGNRGSGLAAAIDKAAEAATAQGRSEIWVWHSNRLGRGTGRPGEARALGALLYHLRSLGVSVRSVEDDQFTTTAILWSFLSEMASSYSETLSATVKRGKRARAMRGDWLGSIRLDGYMKREDAMIKDPERQEVYELLWAMALEGRSEQGIQLEFSRRGFMTSPVRKDHKPRPFDVNRISQALDCATYAGIVVHNDETLPVQGKWPRYIEPEDFYRLRAERRRRCNQTRRKVGRPVEGHLLSELATCGLCGGAVHAQTSRRPKADGTRTRSYVCRAHREHHRDAQEWCPATPFNATTIDCNVLADLGNLIRETNGFAEALRAGRGAERDGLTNIAAQAQDEARTSERAAERAERRYADSLEGDDEHTHAVLLTAASEKHAQAGRANSRLEAALDALQAVSGEAEGDPAGLALGRLWAALSGRLEAADDVRTINTALREDFVRFELHHGADGGFGIVPVLNPAAAVRFAEGRLHPSADANPQPLRWRLPRRPTQPSIARSPAPPSPVEWRGGARGRVASWSAPDQSVIVCAVRSLPSPC
jgi:DNA invertase Pin-like site-specific DNA recombinase